MRSPTTILLLLAALLLAAPWPARADQPTDKQIARAKGKPSAAVMAEARRRFIRANELYRQGNYKEALLVYQAALDLYVRPQILYNMAQTYEKLREPDKAAIFFRRYLNMRPRASDRRAVEDRIARLRRLAKVDVAVTSFPPGAAIYVGDRESGVRGRTPFSLKLPLGSQQIILELDGFVPEKREIEVKLGQRNLLDVQLRRRSSIRVDADAPGARASVLDEEGKPLKTRRVPHVFELSPGTHLVQVELQGYQTVRREVELRDGEQISFLVNLKPLPKYGQLMVEGVSGGRVLLEGKPFDDLPMKPRRLEAGIHRVTVSREGYRPWDGRVTVNPDSLTVARVSLSPYRSTVTNAAVYSSAGLAVASLVTGSIFGVLALRSEREFNSNTSATVDTFNRGQEQALTADVFFAVAGASALAAVVTYLVTRTGPSSADFSFSVPSPPKQASR